ncbi:glycosyltransferase [Paracnuella aquatica]|uniref:glycosyltransferase n=1 Tax=Paracnuella aquatica TaxID=2268757 RepID=UPI000DEF70BD|nr:glycosyltransferase [Paracnuella aquatica]RPD51026.1 glycosyltransferase [Paracnuella aquatica]
MGDIRSVFIGNFSLSAERKVFGLKNYAKFYNELAAESKTGTLSVFAGYILPGDPGFDFSFEQPLSDKINFTLSRGNSTDTGLFQFLLNNILLFIKLTRFCFKRGNYFIFLPSPVGVWSILILTLFRRASTLGIYIGGHYGREQSVEKRKGNIKRTIKKLAAILVDKLVIYAINRSDYVITSSYEYHHDYKNTGKVFLTPPMLNVQESDLNISMQGHEKCITFCGELRHAKGVVDLLKAFVQLVNKRQLTGYKLKIIGSGQALGELVHLAEINGISHLVTFCGQIKQQSQLKEQLATATIFVLPSYSEGFPRVAYESFTLGVPTILTPVGGIPFLAKDKEHCLFAEPGNVDDLANKISLLLNDEGLRSKLSIHARNLMTQEIFPRIKSHVSLSRMILAKMDSLNHVGEAGTAAFNKDSGEQKLSLSKAP